MTGKEGPAMSGGAVDARADQDLDARANGAQDAEAVRADWEQRIYRRLTDTTGADEALALPAPAGVTAEPGVGHVRLCWDPVPGAAGYVIERTAGSGSDGGAGGRAGARGRAGGGGHAGAGAHADVAGHANAGDQDREVSQILRHGGSDVPAVAGPPFADTGIADETDYRYRIGAVAGAEYPVWYWSEPVQSRTAPGDPGPVTVRIDTSAVCGQLGRVWQMVGSERLSQLRLGADDAAGGTAAGGGAAGGLAAAKGKALAAGQAQAGGEIAAEFAIALGLAHTDLGATTVRAHAILHDDNAVVRRDPGGVLRFDFARVDAIYDQLLALGLRPVVELSFMPAALASDPDQTVFTYRGIISPPADWAHWRQLVTELATHLVERYGIDEVAQWAFEVWNEPNLDVFWTGTRDEYLRLYDESARAIKAVDRRLRVGGPSTAASEWIEHLAAHAAETGVALDFVSSHTYGNLPLDARPSLRRHGFDGIRIWWTEWGVGSTHFGPVHDGVIGAPFVLSGFRSAQGRMDAMAYWVISDHFEELGRPQRLFHNGFGLLSIGNLRKPRYWAVHLAAHLGDHVLATRVEGDGADTLVQALAARDDDGTVDVLVWNGTINADLMAGDPRLDRQVKLAVTGLEDTPYTARLARIDEQHSNIAAHCPADVTWPDDALWARLRANDELHEERLPDVTPQDGAARFRFDLPMPGVARIRLSARHNIVWHG